MGAAAAVYVGGRKVVDLWGGVADRDAGTPYTEDSLQLVFSTTKGATAACANLLAQRGELDIDAPVAEYWPEFKANGKGDIPVRWLLCHKAGPALRRCHAHPRGGAGLGSDDPRPRGAGAGLGARHRARLPRHHLRLAGGRGGPADLRQEPGHVLPRRDRRAPRPRVLDRPPRRAAGAGRAAASSGATAPSPSRRRRPGHGRADRAVHGTRQAARQGARRPEQRVLRRRRRLQQPGDPRRRDPRRQRRHQRSLPRPLLRRAHRHRRRRAVRAAPHRGAGGQGLRAADLRPGQVPLLRDHLRPRVLRGVPLRALRRRSAPSGTPAPVARWASPTPRTASASAT